MNKELDLEKIKNREGFPLNTTFYIVTKDEFAILEEALKENENKSNYIYTVTDNLQSVIDKALKEEFGGAHMMPISIEVSINSAYVNGNGIMSIELDTTENANSNRLKQLYGDNYKKGETK